MAIKNLKELIRNMQPELVEKGFVFCSTNKKINASFIMMFKEKEGSTFILKQQDADRLKLDYKGIWDLITLNVNSDLEAIGFLAKITETLAKEGISVNAVSAYYHDHIFVPSSKSDNAIITLKKMRL